MSRISIALYLIFLVFAIYAQEGEDKHLKINIEDIEDIEDIVDRTPLHAPPYLVSLESYSRYHFCTGTIILPQWILTAAHCLQNEHIPHGVIHIRAGLKRYVYNPYSQRRRAESYKIYQFYNPKTRRGDIAIIKLDRPLIFDSRVQPIKLHVGRFILPDYLTVPGWSTNIEDKLPQGQFPSRILRQETVPGISWEECKRIYRNHPTNISDDINSGKLCADLPEGDNGSCHGDSGGPAISLRSGRLIGVTSWVLGCSWPGYPGIYTAVTNFRGWIENATGEKLPN